MIRIAPSSIRLFLLLALWACCRVQAAVPDAAAQVRLALRAEAVVTDRRVTVADVAEVAAGAELEGKVKSVSLAATPRVGNVDQLTRTDIERAIRRQLPGAVLSVAWDGAEKVRIQVATREVDGGILTTAARERLESSLAERFAKFEVTPLSPRQNLALPPGEVSAKAREVDVAHLHARVPVWVDLFVDGEFYRSVAVPFAVQAYRQVYVARRELSAADTPTAADFASELREVSSLAGEAVPANEMLEGARLRKKLGQGEVLTRAELGPKEAVYRGDSVRLVVAEGGVVIETGAVAQEDGSVGQPVRVKPSSGADVVLAKVIAAGVVQAEGR